MEYNLTKEQWDEVKVKFSAFSEICERAKELRAEKSEICKDVATIIESKTSEASKLLKAMLKKWENGESDEEKIALMLEQMASNS